MVAATSLADLGRSGLTGHQKRFTASLPSQTLAHHMGENRLHGLDGGGFGNLLSLYHGRKFHHRLAVFHNTLHKSRSHHFSAVGYGVVEGQRRDGRHLGFITDAHPRQRGLTPVDILSATVLFRHPDMRGS